MTHAILTQVEHTATWIFAVLIVAFILGAIWAVVDGAVGYASARIVRKPAAAIPMRAHLVRPFSVTAAKGFNRRKFDAIVGGRQ